MINKISKLQTTTLPNHVLLQRIEEFIKERKHPWGCWLAYTLRGLERVGLAYLAENGFEQLRELKASEVRTQLLGALQACREREWAAHSQLEGKRVQRLLLPKPGGCDSVAAVLVKGSFLQRKFVAEPG